MPNLTLDDKRQMIADHCEQQILCSDCPDVVREACTKYTLRDAPEEWIGVMFNSLFPTKGESDTTEETPPTDTASVDNVNHPSHYETGKYECIEAMIETQGKEAVQSFCVCNAFKYLWRHTRKNKLEDVKKAIWYLNKFVELEEQT